MMQSLQGLAEFIEVIIQDPGQQPDAKDKQQE
jgi:hypothetical protein